jgi:hypothetical protein
MDISKIKITQADEARLTPHLAGWNKFMASLGRGLLLKTDMEKMILIENKSINPRVPILLKLIVRIQKREREDLIAKLKCWNHNLRGL